LRRLPPRAGAPPANPNANRGREPQGTFDGVYVSATRETSSGDVILKLVNVQATPQPLRVGLSGLRGQGPGLGRGWSFRPGDIRGEVLTGTDTDINTVAEPTKVVPKPVRVPLTIVDAPMFNHELPARSVTVLRVRTR
jgi:alpha-L-arabinofuranosidase